MKRNYARFWRNYARQTETGLGDLYKNISRVISPAVKGEVLDVGSAGVVNYDLARVDSLTTVDLFSVRIKLPVKHRHLVSDVRYLSLPAGRFDTVLAQFLFHHLAEKTLDETDRSVIGGLAEIKRVLKPGGEILVVESFLPRYLEIVEETGYPLLMAACRMINFPQVRQYSLSKFLKLTEVAGLKCRGRKILDKGRFVSQFGLKIPAALSPVEVYFLNFGKPRLYRGK